jgi:hypothetical protein
MKEKEIKLNEIIVVEQLPVIKETLEKIGKQIKKSVKEALSLECKTEEDKQKVKKAKADINKYKDDFETRRKEVKNQILLPYTEFEVIYNKEIKEPLQTAYDELNTKVLAIDDQTKTDMKNEVVKYFNEYLKSKNIDFVKFEDVNLNITLNASMKSLKESVKTMIDKVVDELELIDTQEHKEEILVEYKNNFNVAEAITKVSARHKAIEEEIARKESLKQVQQVEQEVINKVDQVLSAPVQVIDGNNTEEYLNEIIYDVTFTITASRIKIRELKEYMKKEGIIYE